MEPIRVVRGAATGPTAMASYDAALAAAGVENYNLVPVSSIVPEGAEVRVAETAPDLGPAGGRLTVIEARGTVAPEGGPRVCAGLGWAVEASGRGIFYEASGADPDAVRATVEDGLRAGRDLREWTFVDGDLQVVTAAAEPDAYATAVVLAVYGRSEPIL